MRDRFMMATAASHGFCGDVSRDKPSLVVITGEEGDCWVGEWVTGLGLIHVLFPKATTRPLNAEEREQYDGRWVQSGNGEWQIRIRREDA